MEKLKSTLITAVKNVWYSKTKYVYFAIFLILIQSLLSCIILFNHNNNQNELKYYENSFVITSDSGVSERYHAVLNNLEPHEASIVIAHYAGLQEEDRYYSIVMHEKVKISEMEIRHNLYLYFERAAEPNATPYELYQRFISTKMYEENIAGVVDLQQTPLLKAYRSQTVNNSVTTLICVFVTAVGTLMFAILFNTVVNHFKFSYGIYMTFGANFRKLLVNAISEMLVINVFTFIPSFLLSLLITYFLTIRSGYGISVLLYPMFLSLLCSSILTVIAVTLVIKRLSVQTPNKLIRSVNNAGLITSPRFSKRIPASGYPVKSELLSLKRFVRYIVTLTLSTVIFASLYFGGVYLSRMQTEKEALPMPQFKLAFPVSSIEDEPDVTTEATDSTSSPEEEEVLPPIIERPEGYTYTEDVKKNLYHIDGIDYIVKDRSVLATTIKSHVLIHPSDLTMSAKSLGVKNTDGFYGFCNVSYKLLDEEVLDNIRFMGGTVTGDLEAVLNEPNTIVISDSINNSRSIKLEVGDTIRVSVSYYRRRLWPKEPITTNREYMETCFRCYYFNYVELKVGAIVSDLPVGSEFPIYMNAKTFKTTTGQEPYFVNVSLYCNENLSSEEIQDVQRQLYDLKHFYKMAVTNTNHDTDSVVTYMKNYPGIILYISLLLLFVSVLITVLNQTLFYQMRKQEFDIYLCLGSNFKRLRKLFWVDATFFSLLSSAVYTVFSFVVSMIVFKVGNMSIAESVIRYRYTMPLIPFLFGLAVVAGASFFSVMLSYWIFKKRSAPVFTGAPVSEIEVGDASSKKSVIFDSDAR